MGKLLESHIKSPCQYSLRSRTKFGDPNEKSMNKTSANEPGYGWCGRHSRSVCDTDDDDAAADDDNDNDSDDDNNDVDD
jgi:hypothetical protein